MAFATPLRRGQLLLYDWQRRQVVRAVQLEHSGPPRIVTSLSALPCGRLLAASTADGLYIMCQHGTSEAVRVSAGGGGAAGFCCGGRRLLAARGCAVEVWDTAAALERARLLLGGSTA